MLSTCAVSIIVSPRATSLLRRYEAFQVLSCYQSVLSTALCRHLLMVHTICILIAQIQNQIQNQIQSGQGDVLYPG